MFRGIEYYKRVSKELEEIIEIYESSYKGFETAVLSVVDHEHPMNEEQKKIRDEFVEFCQNEGIDYNQGVGRYKNMVDAVKERVEFLKEKKKINDELLQALKRIEKLKDNEIDKKTRRAIIEEAIEKYDKGSDKYNRFVKRKLQEEKEKQLEENIEIQKKQTAENKKFKQKNGLACVAAAALGPLGNPVYNAWATVRNANTRLRKRHPFINAVVKVGMLVGSMALASTLALGVGGTLIAGAGIIGATVNTVRHIIDYKNVPPIVEKRREYNGYVNGIKDAWFRFRKSRGNTNISTQEKLYNGIDMGKYEAKPAKSEGMTEGKGERSKGAGSKVGETMKPVPAPVETEEETIPAPVEAEEEAIPAPVEAEEEAIPAPVETEEEAIPAPVETEEEAIPAPVEAEEEAIPDPVETEEEAIPAPVEAEEEAIPAPVEAEEEETKYAITELDEWIGMKRARELFVKQRAKSSDLTEIAKCTNEINKINKLLKSVSPEVQRQIDTMETFEQAKFNEKAAETGLPLNGAYNKARLSEFESLREFIQNAPSDQEVDDKVQFAIQHYKFNKKQLAELMSLVLERNRISKENASGRGK